VERNNFIKKNHWADLRWKINEEWKVCPAEVNDLLYDAYVMKMLDEKMMKEYENCILGCGGYY
jgi:hypothetical protein